MLTTEQIAQFQQNGFIAGGPVLADEAVETLRQELQRVIDQQEQADVPQPVHIANLSRAEGRPIWQIVNIWQASPAFKDLIHNQAILTMMAQLTEAHQLRVWHDQIQYKPMAEGGQLHWHQDSPKWGILMPKTAQVTAWVALDNADESNGCMYMVPGSHHWGDNDRYLNELPHGEDLPPTFQNHAIAIKTCPVKKGHVHFHHALTWHGSGTNTSQRPRRAIAIHYMTQETIYIAAGRHVMKQFVTVEDGAQLTGDHFPLVWQDEA